MSDNYCLQTLSGWGQQLKVEGKSFRPEKIAELRQLSAEHLLMRGCGRSYGDAALPTDNGAVIMSERLNRFLSFDPDKGMLKAETGVTLQEVIETFVPYGWFPYTVPGTQYVSLGGCLASDVHGKNHHRDGSFSAQVPSFKLLSAQGSEYQCSAQETSDLYWATIGGMGLTGIVTELDLKLRPIETAYIKVKQHQTRDLEQTLGLLELHANTTLYSVAWIDCLGQSNKLGRSIVFQGRHALADELPKKIKNPLFIQPKNKLTIPFNMPPWLLNQYSIKAFNELYYRKHRDDTESFVDYRQFFFPLDNLKHWYRLYGKLGFYQYQVVFPEQQALEGLQALLNKLQNSKADVFLAVLKRMGDANMAPLSFPRAGFTLALDIPNRGHLTTELLQALDEITVAHYGRVYLAKDATLSAQHFQKMYPRYQAWLNTKKAYDPNFIFLSHLANRIGLVDEKDTAI